MKTETNKWRLPSTGPLGVGQKLTERILTDYQYTPDVVDRVAKVASPTIVP